MTTEVEKLTSEMQRYGVITMNRWACDGAALLRSQAAEIERLREILARALAQMLGTQERA